MRSAATPARTEGVAVAECERWGERSSRGPPVEARLAHHYLHTDGGAARDR